jgi:hypothetical protein
MLMALWDKNGINPLIGNIEVTPFGSFTQTAIQITGGSINVTVTTIYFVVT